MHVYRNLSLSKKILISLMIIAILGTVIGALGINGMSQLSQEDQRMYQYNTLPMEYLATMFDTLASQRICANNAVIFRETDPVFSKEEQADIANKEAQFDAALQSFFTVLSDDEERALYNKIDRMYYSDFKNAKDQVYAAIASGDAHAISDAIYRMDDIGAEISDCMDQAFSINDKLASEKVASNKALSQNLTIIVIVAMAAGLLASVVFSIVVGGIISNPLNRVMNATRQVAETGSLKFSSQEIEAIRQDARSTDETGRMANAFAAMMDALMNKTSVLEIIAEGDLTPEVPLASDQDTMGNALKSMVDSLSGSFGQIHTAAQQVSAGSKQIADGAQTLAQGSTEQSSAIEQLSASIGEITGMTKQNADIAKEASLLSETIRSNAVKGNSQMGQMMDAVREINEASTGIGKVIKVIDDIAFQTNILALNAAVEAARAGQHGKGFAVVAEEVGNLAAKSAEAAKDTGVMIENSIAKANLGLNIATETSASLGEIVEGINRSAQIVSQIAQSSDAQADAIAQINIGIDQVAQVVQLNSATSQESAAAAAQMNDQSDILEQLVAQFKIRDAQVAIASPARGNRRELPPAHKAQPALHDTGKY